MLYMWSGSLVLLNTRPYEVNQTVRAWAQGGEYLTGLDWDSTKVCHTKGLATMCLSIF